MSRSCSSAAAIHSPAASGVRSGVIRPAPPALARSAANRVDAVALDGVPVGHHQRSGVPVAATASTVRSTSRGADAAVERLLGGGLDRGAVHHRVAVGQADLDRRRSRRRPSRAARRCRRRRRGSRRAGSRPARRGRRRGPSRRRSRRTRLTPTGSLGSSSASPRPNHSMAVPMSLSPRPVRLTRIVASGPFSAPSSLGDARARRRPRARTRSPG